MTTHEITEAVALKVRETVDAGLSHGLGKPIPGQMCVEAAVCYALGLPHSDDPGCVAPSLRRLKIRLNDASWSSPQARARGLRRLALAQLGSVGVLDESEFLHRVVEMTIRKAVPVGLRVAARLIPTHVEALETAAVRCEQEGTREACEAAAATARAAADTAYAAATAAAYTADAAAYTAYAAATAAAYTADAAAYTAYAAAYTTDAAYDAAAAATAAAAAYTAYADAARTRDRVLADYAEWVVDILIDLQAPGCQWLYLVPTGEAA